MLSLLVSKLIVGAQVNGGVLEIALDDGIGLSISNAYNIRNEGGVSGSELTGKKVVHVDEDDDSVRIELEGGQIIEIDLSDEGYNGPEAMVLTVPDQPTFVWN